MQQCFSNFQGIYIYINENFKKNTKQEAGHKFTSKLFYVLTAISMLVEKICNAYPSGNGSAAD